jgi:hypothetical protein
MSYGEILRASEQAEAAGDTDRALALARSAHEVQPGRPEVMLWLAQLLVDAYAASRGRKVSLLGEAQALLAAAVRLPAPSAIATLVAAEARRLGVDPSAPPPAGQEDPEDTIELHLGPEVGSEAPTVCVDLRGIVVSPLSAGGDAAPPRGAPRRAAAGPCEGGGLPADDWARRSLPDPSAGRIAPSREPAGEPGPDRYRPRPSPHTGNTVEMGVDDLPPESPGVRRYVPRVRPTKDR